MEGLSLGLRWRSFIGAPPRWELASLTHPKTTSSTRSKSKSKSKSGVATSCSSKTDKSGRLCSPRAGRELAVSIIYSACLQGSDPVRLLDSRMKGGPTEWFDRGCLAEYEQMRFGGPPVSVHTVEEEEELLRTDAQHSAIEAQVLCAPPKLVYNNFILRFTRKLIVAVTQSWDANVVAIDKVAPPNWKNHPAARILELTILHIAMSEIALLQTRHQIVINEAVDLAKRFCDGAAPRIINGCLRTFVQDLQQQ